MTWTRCVKLDFGSTTYTRNHLLCLHPELEGKRPVVLAKLPPKLSQKGRANHTAATFIAEDLHP